MGSLDAIECVRVHIVSRSIQQRVLHIVPVGAWRDQSMQRENQGAIKRVPSP